MPPKTISGECVFEQDWKTQYLWCKYSVIWKYLEDNYSSNYSDIQSFIKDRLEEQDKMKVLTPKPNSIFFGRTLEEQDKMKVLTPAACSRFGENLLEEQIRVGVVNVDIFTFTTIEYLKKNLKTK